MWRAHANMYYVYEIKPIVCSLFSYLSANNVSAQAFKGMASGHTISTIWYPVTLTPLSRALCTVWASSEQTTHNGRRIITLQQLLGVICWHLEVVHYTSLQRLTWSANKEPSEILDIKVPFTIVFYSSISAPISWAYWIRTNRYPTYRCHLMAWRSREAAISSGEHSTEAQTAFCYT